ncbi:hypothetical protein SKAU_G00384440 [Synaphobranchus kaupii]|uniref:Uncharacterized protein n=1 Tax=Synaphobranchus kaupii TaxID=118154 RepID=A0A9Q1EE82_SYNKA|nr:hypothetical protein SKAU_G00384440 [Synaphobranchus kaupii]
MLSSGLQERWTCSISPRWSMMCGHPCIPEFLWGKGKMEADGSSDIESDIELQRRDCSYKRRALFGWAEATFIEYTAQYFCFQPRRL